MTTYTILQTLGLNQDSEFANAAARFVEAVKEFAVGMLEEEDIRRADQQERAVELLYAGFFKYAVEWAETQHDLHKKRPGHPDAEKLKILAMSTREDLQKNILRYIRCYMYLNRSFMILQGELECCATGARDQGVKWTPDTDVLWERFRKERAELEESNEKLARACEILTVAEKDFDCVEQSVQKLFGKKPAQELLPPFRFSLRCGDFEKAEKILTALENVKRRLGADKAGVKIIQESGRRFRDVLEKHQDILKDSENKTYLRPGEVRIVLEAQKQDIIKKTALIQKYHQPYIEYKIKALGHLKEKLRVIGSLESLTTLYIRMIRGIAEPMIDAKIMRKYEEEVVGHIDYLLGSQFQEIENIEKRSLALVERFKEDMKEFKKGTAHAGL